MEPAPKQEADAIAPVPKPRKGPKFVTHKNKIDFLPKAAIAAAAIAAVTLSTGVRRRNNFSRTSEGSRSSLKDSSSIEVRPQRRRNRNRAPPTLCDAASLEYKHTGCNCQFVASAQSANRSYARSVHSSSSNSSSKDKTCLYCMQKRTEDNKCNCCESCEGATQNGPREVQRYSMYQPFGCYPQTQLPEQQRHFFARNPVCYALHECCCEHQIPSYPNNGPVVTPVGFCCSTLPSASPNHSPFKTCCAQRVRHGVNPSPTASNSNICRKKHIHPQISCCDCHPKCSPPFTPVRTVKALKSAKSRPRDQRVQARRIRHPACDEDSNSETELCTPVVDVRVLRSPTRLSTSTSPGQASPSLNSPARPIPEVCASSSSSCPVAAGPAKVYFCPGPSAQANTFLATAPALPNIPGTFPNTRLAPRAGKDSTSSSSDSSKTSEVPGTISSTSTNSNSSTDLSDSSTTSNEDSRTSQPQRYPYLPMAAPSLPNSQPFQANAGVVRNPIHTYYQNPLINPAGSRGTPLPISSGDYWNVRRPWPRSERRTDLPAYAARMAREGDNQAAQWLRMAQPSTSNPSVQRPRDVRREWEQHRYNT